ncbi:flagellin [Ureibacillus xyleni]|uniref:Flagellin n=1 Tax=Ureibacillus xyleni TaxID=614648 RepID=A0A285SYK6_9BACL|nr:hypothetical protein [Ureibacillus xyleni]SOC13178.1 flagellin [Ureibacillus xyleni]
MRINHDLLAYNTYKQLTTNTVDTNKSLEKLSLRNNINSTSNEINLELARRRYEIDKLSAPQKQIQDTKAKLDIAEGGLKETDSLLFQMKELAGKASNDISDSDRSSYQEQFNSLAEEITKIGDKMKINGENALDGILNLVTQTSNLGGHDRSGKIGDMLPGDLGISGLSISTKTDATAAFSKIEEAMSTISDQLSSVGAESNRLDKMFRNIQPSIEYLENTNSTSRTTSINIEEEMKKLEEMKQKMVPIINNLHQNQNPIGVLQLLRG